MAKKKTELAFEGKDKEYYEALMHARDIVTKQMQYHAEDALDCTNADKTPRYRLKLVENEDPSIILADVSSDNSRHEMELRMLTEEGNVLQLIEDALQRLADGEYGRCQECGEMISEGRLKIRPYAVFCVKCKSRHEQMR